MKDIKLRLYYNEIFTYTNVFKYVKIDIQRVVFNNVSPVVKNYFFSLILKYLI